MASCSKAGGGDGPPPTPKSCIRVLMNPLSPPSASSFDALRSYSSASNGEATLLKAAAQYFSQIAADDTPFDVHAAAAMCSRVCDDVQALYARGEEALHENIQHLISIDEALIALGQPDYAALLCIDVQNAIAWLREGSHLQVSPSRRGMSSRVDFAAMGYSSTSTYNPQSEDGELEQATTIFSPNPHPNPHPNPCLGTHHNTHPQSYPKSIVQLCHNCMCFLSLNIVTSQELYMCLHKGGMQPRESSLNYCIISISLPSECRISCSPTMVDVLIKTKSALQIYTRSSGHHLIKTKSALQIYTRSSGHHPNALASSPSIFK